MATQVKGITAADLQPPITVQEWGRLEGPPHYDLVDGTLEEKPEVALWHGLFLIRLASLILRHAEEHKLGLVLTSTAKVRIAANRGRLPDIFVIPSGSLHLAGINVFKGIPALVVEILSPSNEDTDRVDKYSEYASLGVGEYWIVDVPNRRLEVHELRRCENALAEYELKEVAADDAIFRPTLFPGLEIDLGEIWPSELEGRLQE